MLRAMADAKASPEFSTREDGVYAKMAQTSKVMKNIESKPIPPNEAAEIEQEMLRAMADAKASPEVSTKEIEAEMLQAMANA